MINSLLVESNNFAYSKLIEKVKEFCPSINLIEQTACPISASDILLKKNTNLVFLPFKKIEYLNQFPPSSFEVICIGENKINAFEAIKHNAVGFLIPPFKREDIVLCVNNAIRRLQANIELNNSQSKNNNLLGIPTMEGLEFFAVNDIIRCEGFQKCTRLITTCNSRILSSYNIGEFKKILTPHNFYMPHKSFLINLSHIKKYHKEGTIIMSDGQGVPVSRRKKSEFLKQVFHL